MIRGLRIHEADQSNHCVKPPIIGVRACEGQPARGQLMLPGPVFGVESQAMTETDPPIAAEGDQSRPDAEGKLKLPGPIATALAWIALRFANWPGRRLVGWGFRIRSKGRGGRGFAIRTPDGTRLALWHIPPNPDAPRRVPIVMLHGWLEIKEFHFSRAHRFADRGHPVLLFDHRGHGKSAFRSATFGYREREDLAAVIDQGVRRGIIDEQLVTLGYSMGASTVLQHAATDPRVKGVVAFAPFAELPDAILTFRDLLMPCIDDRSLLAGFERAARGSGFRLDQVSTPTALADMHTPAMLIEATEDHNLPPDVHMRPLLLAKRSGDILHYRVEGATHFTLCRENWPGLDEAVNAFCDRVANGPSAKHEPPMHVDKRG